MIQQLKLVASSFKLNGQAAGEQIAKPAQEAGYAS
jgi:hypothetical protein